MAELEGYLSTVGHPGVNEDHWNGTQQVQQIQQFQPPQELVQVEEVDTLSSAIREISLGVNGHFIGGTSTVTLGILLDSVIKGQDASGRTSRRDSEGSEEMRVDFSAAESPSSTALAEMMGPMFVSDNTSKRLFDGYLKNIATRFPVLHTPRIKELHEHREIINNSFDQAILHLVYAISGRFLELSGQSDDNFYSDQHCEAAVAHMNEILGFGDMRSVVYLILLGVYSIRAAKDLGAWTYVGLAMRLCVDVGIHRRIKIQKPSLRSEMDKRIFWSCYYLDREISVAMGRPPALSDNDIDANLPFDIDEAADDEETILRASTNISDKPCNPPTSLTSFIHQLRLKKIESEIQHLVYRVDTPFDASQPLIQELYDRLLAWEQSCPDEARGPVQDLDNKPVDSIDVYVSSLSVKLGAIADISPKYIHYYRACRLLLYPTLTCSPVNKHYVSLCAEACGNLCESYKVGRNSQLLTTTKS